MQTLAETMPLGWSFPPNYPLGAITAETLPELPLLRVLAPLERNRAIVTTLRGLPFLRQVTPRHVADRYGMSITSAWDLVNRARYKDAKSSGEKRALQAAQRGTGETK